MLYDLRVFFFFQILIKFLRKLKSYFKYNFFLLWQFCDFFLHQFKKNLAIYVKCLSVNALHGSSFLK